MGRTTFAAKSCLRHRVYVTYGHAAKVAKRMLREKGHHLRVFKCPMCGNFHLGHAPPPADADTADLTRGTE